MKKIHYTLIVPFKKSKTVCFFSNGKHGWTFYFRSRYPVKLIFAFGLASSFCCLLKSIAINLYYFLNQG